MESKVGEVRANQLSFCQTDKINVPGTIGGAELSESADILVLDFRRET